MNEPPDRKPKKATAMTTRPTCAAALRALAVSLALAPIALRAEGAAPLAPASSPARRTVSLREALELAVKQGPDLEAARAQALVAAAGVERAFTAWKPELTATGALDHTSAPASFDVGQFAGLIAQLYGLAPPDPRRLPPPTTIVATNSEYGQLQLVQPLFTPQGVFLPGAAKAGEEAAARGADEAREQVLLGVARTYDGLLGIDGLIAAARDAEKVALRREEDARAQVSAGTAIEVALLRAQSETAAARAQIAALEGQRDSLLFLLEALVGEPIAPAADGAREPQLGEPAEESSAPWEETFAVKAAAAAVRANEALVRYDRFQWLPTVAGVARGNYNSNTGFSGHNFSYDLLLTVSLPLYDRGARYASLHEDEAKLAQAQAQLASARARARASWAGARANYASARAVLAQQVALAAFADKAQAQVETAARAGVATNLDLSDADARRFGAASAAAQARAALEMRRAELAAAEGRLFRSLSREDRAAAGAVR